MPIFLKIPSFVIMIPFSGDDAVEVVVAWKDAYAAELLTDSYGLDRSLFETLHIRARDYFRNRKRQTGNIDLRPDLTSYIGFIRWAISEKFRSFIYCPPIQLNNFLRIFSNKSYMLQYVNAVYDPEPPKYDCPPIQLNNDCFYSCPCHSKIVLSK